VAAHGDDVWVALWPSSRIALIDAGTLRKRTRDIDVGLNPFRVVADATGAWVTCAGTGRLIRVRRS
jgi:YVTN family beta-propeller protein